MAQASLRIFGLQMALDFALPPRCGGCGAIVDHVHSFCPDCWKQLEFLGNSGCVSCGLPLQATDADLCAVCLASPPESSERVPRSLTMTSREDWCCV